MRAKILSASAGSGKTYRLAYKFVHDTIKYYNEKPYLYRAILAVTFTNKATEEMKSRILKEINDIVQHPDNFLIGSFSRSHHPQRMSNIVVPGLVQLTRMRFCCNFNSLF